VVCARDLAAPSAGNSSPASTPITASTVNSSIRVKARRGKQTLSLESTRRQLIARAYCGSVYADPGSSYPLSGQPRQTFACWPGVAYQHFAFILAPLKYNISAFQIASTICKVKVVLCTSKDYIRASYSSPAGLILSSRVRTKDTVYPTRNSLYPCASGVTKSGWHCVKARWTLSDTTKDSDCRSCQGCLDRSFCLHTQCTWFGGWFVLHQTGNSLGKKSTRHMS